MACLQGNPAVPWGIEGVNMRNNYYNPMRKLVIVLPCLAGIFFVAGRSAISQGLPPTSQIPQTPAINLPLQKDVPPQNSSAARQNWLQTSSLESHEGVTISARPWTDAQLYKEKFPKKSPFTAGVLAVQVAIRNDADVGVKVGLDRIRLSFRLEDDSNQELQSLSAGQVADAILKPGSKDPTRRRVPLPITTGGNKGKDFEELQTQAQNAAVPTSVIGAHSTVQGLLYFDLQGQFDLLKTAHLYIPDVSLMGRSDGLTYFEIDLSR
jgi:hypothetical protein